MISKLTSYHNLPFHVKKMAAFSIFQYSYMRELHVYTYYEYLYTYIILYIYVYIICIYTCAYIYCVYICVYIYMCIYIRYKHSYTIQLYIVHMQKRATPNSSIFKQLGLYFWDCSDCRRGGSGGLSSMSIDV